MTTFLFLCGSLLDQWSMVNDHIHDCAQNNDCETITVTVIVNMTITIERKIKIKIYHVIYSWQTHY